MAIRDEVCRVGSLKDAPVFAGFSKGIQEGFNLMHNRTPCRRRPRSAARGSGLPLSQGDRCR